MASIGQLTRPLGAGLKNTLRSILITSLVAVAVIVVSVSLDRENSRAHMRETRLRAESEISLIRARITSEIAINVTIVRDLANMIAMSPVPDSVETKRQINWLLIQNPQIASIALAPNFIVSDVIPSMGKESRIGMDIRLPMGTAPGSLQGPATLARFYGPVAGANRGTNFSIVFPVFAMEDGHRRLWGGVEALIDAGNFYTATDLMIAPDGTAHEIHPHLDRMSIALRDKGSAASSMSNPFLGSAAVFDEEPIRRDIDLPGGQWEIAAAPVGGWDAPPANRTALRIIITVAGSIVIVSVFLSCLLFGERIAARNRAVREIEAREAKLVEVSQRLGLALESSNIGIWELHDNGSVVYWDVRAAALHGIAAPESEHHLDEWFGVVHPDDREIAEVHVFNCNCVGAAHEARYRVILPDGEIRYLRSAGAYHQQADGTGKTIGIVADVTTDAMVTVTLRDAKTTSDIKNAELELALDELSQRERQLDELSQKLDLALDSYQCGIWDAVPGKTGARWDERMHELHGLDDMGGGYVSEERWLQSIHPDDRMIARNVGSDYRKPGDTQSIICRVPQPDGSIRYVRSVGKVHEPRAGERKIVGIAFDVTDDALLTAQLKAAKDDAVAKNIELELAKSRIEHNALHDPLTALANRRKLDIALERLTSDGRFERQKFAILHIDLDRFKEINDTLGHAAGDAMLVHVSKVLAKNVRNSDIVARIGGDEFVIVAMDTSDPTAMAELATRLIEQTRQPIDFQGFSCRCGVSIGIAQANGINVDARKVLINADIALYRAKSTGRNRYEFFNQNLQSEVINNKRTADAILTGLENGEFTAWYQPQFDARTMKLTGVEALVRWNHPTRGVLAPDQFLRIANELNVVQTLDRIVLETALKDKMRWAARGIIVPKVSVNVSSRRLHDDGLLDTLQGLQIQPGELSFELVESIFLDESEDVVSQNLDRIKALGIDIEIDDFGTGHTSIVSLLKLKPKRLKIDRQLVSPILTSPQELALVRSIIDIARSLGVETVAEGVESFDHAIRLSDLGCNLLQGYAFSPPLSFDAFVRSAKALPWQQAS